MLRCTTTAACGSKQPTRLAVKRSRVRWCALPWPALACPARKKTCSAPQASNHCGAFLHEAADAIMAVQADRPSILAASGTRPTPPQVGSRKGRRILSPVLPGPVPMSLDDRRPRPRHAPTTAGRET